MKSLQALDLSRSEELETIVSKYMQIAIELLSQIESDHLLAMILEIPSDIDRMSIWEIAVKYKLDDFLDFHRLQPIISHLWNDFQYLDPSKQFESTPLRMDMLLRELWDRPKQWYYSPIGLYILTSVFYIMYVVVITILVWRRQYPYHSVSMNEIFIWIFNAGYVLFEFEEAMFKRKKYFAAVTNYWDIIISVDWILLFLMRFTHDLWYESDYDENDDAKNVDLRNSTLTEVYMALWGVQCVLLWTRLTTLLQRSSRVGPLIQMVMNMIVDVVNFVLVLFVFTMGFVFAIFYIAGGDVDVLDKVPSVFLYVFQTLVGQQEWDDIKSQRDENDSIVLSPVRSRFLEVAIMVFAVLGSILLLNLLIALMVCI